MLFAVDKYLKIVFCQDDGEKIHAEVRAITQPLTGLAIASNQPLPEDKDLDFHLSTGKVTLIRGTGKIVRSFKIRGAYHFGLEVQVTDPISPISVTERLAPFVTPEVKSRYVDTQKNAPQISEAESWLMPWIESSYRLNLLLDLIAKINSTMEIKPLLSMIMEAAKVIMEAEASSLMTLDPETEELIITVSTGAGSEEAPGFRIPKGEGVSGWVVENKKPLVLQDAQKDSRFYGDVAEGFKTKSLICVPLKSSKGEVMGVLEAINKKDGSAFKESDVPIFSALADQAAISLEKAKLYQESLEKKLLEQQLDMARKVQEQFLPKEIPIYEGIELSGMSLPAAHVGGDYYDFIPIDDKKCAVVIADISGKGIPAGLLMSTLRAALRTQVEGKHSIKQTLNLVNNIIFKDTTSDKFVTLFFGIIDAENKEFTYTNAGHNPPYIFDQTDNTLETLTDGGPVLGVFKDFDYPSKKITLHPGQFIVMFTDGITEAMNKKKEYFDERRLENIILECGNISANALMQKIYSEVKKHSQGVAQYDDITMLIVKMLH